ncbi:MAG TPA: maleylpyruvate isomerase family mycothiol-dependent enzyme [Pseudonocardia sp.]|nr:maleylpyruvate isomerase family mycothiol-dependent enzyme [Pseudonocardia sp.]
MTLTDLLRLDATALALLGHDVAMIPDSALANPTPCEGWTVADLLSHMNERHNAVAQTMLPPLDEVSGDPRDDFARITARWIVTIEQAGQTVNIPRRGGPQPTEWILGVHVVDMLVHRWDLASALQNSLSVPAGLTDAALPLARANTAPGSPLNGPDGDYRRPFAEDPANSTMDTIVALLGRNPRWSPQVH